MGWSLVARLRLGAIVARALEARPFIHRIQHIFPVLVCRPRSVRRPTAFHRWDGRTRHCHADHRCVDCVDAPLPVGGGAGRWHGFVAAFGQRGCWNRSACHLWQGRQVRLFVHTS